jgi:ribosomal protein S12 methylthiotransferase
MLNPPDLRPDLAPRARIADAPRPGQPTVGMVSLGCPKALVDSERILTRLRAEGYAISPDYAGAEAVIVNTCGFLDSAKAESLEAIGEAIQRNGKVIVTGCLGADPSSSPARIPRSWPSRAPTSTSRCWMRCTPPCRRGPIRSGPAAGAGGVADAPSLQLPQDFRGLQPQVPLLHHPDMRGRLASRPAHAVVREAERLVAAGVKELLVISQDTSAYGLDLRHAEERGHRAHVVDLARDLGRLGAWVRLHYVYPYPHVRDLIPLMADGLVLPYLDIPFQHAHPDTLRRMARPAAAARTLDEIAAWRAVCPEIVLRSTFIVGYPGETEAEFQTLLDWLDEAQLDRVGCFQYEDVAGARSNLLPDHVAPEVKQERWARFMEKAQGISEAKLAAKVGRRMEVLVDEVDADGATCRTKGDAPEIDGNLFIDEGFEGLSPATS